MAVACLVGRHAWHPMERAEMPRLDPQQCNHCGKTRIWNARDEAWIYGPAEGLPEDAVEYLASAGEARNAADTNLPIADELHYASGGGGFIPAGIIVAAMGLPVWLAAPAWAPKLAIGIPLVLFRWMLAGGRRDVRVNRKHRTVIHRARLLPLTLFRRVYRPGHFRKIRVAWEPNARVPAPRRGPRPHFAVRAVAGDGDLLVINCFRPKSAGRIGRSVARALDIPVEDKTREPGAPGT